MPTTRITYGDKTDGVDTLSADEVDQIKSVTNNNADEVDTLASSVAGKANAAHSHTASDISDFDTEVANNTTVQANVAGLAALTAAQIKTLYESNNNTNVLTDTLAAILNTVEENAKDDQNGNEIIALIDAILGTTWKTGGTTDVIPNYADVGSAPDPAAHSGKFVLIADDWHKSDGTNWVDQTSDLAGSDIVTLLNAELGNTTWQSGGGTAQYLPSFANIGAAPSTGVPTGAFAFINDKIHKYDGSTWVDQTDDLTDAEIVTAINTELGNTTWQGGSSGGSSLIFDWLTADGGFSGSDLTNWISSSGDLTSIQDLKSSQLFVPNTAGELQHDAGEKFFSADTTDTQLDINNGNSTYLNPGTGEFTIMVVMDYRGSNSSRHIKFQNNGSSNSIKFQSSGIEIRMSGFTTETIPFTLVDATTYFFAVQRTSTGSFKAYVYDGTGAIKYAGETTGTSSLDTGGVNELTLGDTEAAYLMLIFTSALLEPALDRAAAQAGQDFTLGTIA